MSVWIIKKHTKHEGFDIAAVIEDWGDAEAWLEAHWPELRDDQFFTDEHWEVQ